MLKAARIAELVQPYLAAAPNLPATPNAVIDAGGSVLFDQLEVYLELLMRWNAKTNLTAVREPEEIVRRHFGESLFVGAHVARCETLLDYGSGGGFPGIPIQLLLPALKVTLAESQGKKAAFLREAVRTLGLDAEVWGKRVESMAVGRKFDVVVLRAVDDMRMAWAEAGQRARSELICVGTSTSIRELGSADDFQEASRFSMPESSSGVVLVARRKDVQCSTWNTTEAGQS